MNWTQIWQDVISSSISGVIIAAICGGTAWFLYSTGIKGKEKAQRAHERKIEIFIPLKNEMKNLMGDAGYISASDLWKKAEAEIVYDIVTRNDEMVVADYLFEQCERMEKLIQEYNSIDLYTVADNILCKWFREKYIEVYGSITHPITHYDEYSHEEIELIEDDPEFDSFRMTVGDRKNINKIFANRSYQEFCEEMSQYGPVDNFLSRICDGIIHGDPYHGIQFDKIGDEALKEHKITPGEYMVKGFNFFKTFDADSDVLKKEKILSEIRELAHDIYENVQVKIRDIGKKYEQE